MLLSNSLWLVDSLLQLGCTVGYPSDSLASCSLCDFVSCRCKRWVWYPVCFCSSWKLNFLCVSIYKFFTIFICVCFQRWCFGTPYLRTLRRTQSAVFWPGTRPTQPGHPSVARQTWQLNLIAGFLTLYSGSVGINLLTPTVAQWVRP